MAARNAFSTRRCSAGSAVCRGAPSATARRAREASCRAAGTDVPSADAISSNGTANASCSTNATRCSGLSRSSTTSSAVPTSSLRVGRLGGVGRR